MAQLLTSVTVMIFKQFVDGVPQKFRGTAVMDGGTQMQPLFHPYLPMNGGIITALAFITFII